MAKVNITNAIETIEKRFGKKLLSMKDVSDYLGIDNDTIRILVEDGNLDAVGSGENIYFKPISLVKFEHDIKADSPNPYLPVGSGVDNVKVTDGSIYKTNSKKNPLEMSFIITFDDGTKQRVKVRGQNKTEILQKKPDKVAEEIRKHRNSLMDSPVYDVKKTFQEVSNEWFEEFLAEQKSKGNSFSNIETTKYALVAINKVIGTMDIMDIDQKIAQDMIDTVSWDDVKKKWNSKSHVTKIMRSFKNIMKYARKMEYTDILIDKLTLNKNLHEPSKNDRFIDEESMAELFKCVKNNDRYNLLIHIIFSSGLRQEEALALEISDFSNKNGIYNIYISKANVETSRNKYEIVNTLKHGEPPRFVPIAKETYDMAIEYYQKSMNDMELTAKRKLHGTEKLLFVNKDGKPLNKRTLYHNFTDFLDRNYKDKINDITLHKLRHTFASLMCDSVSLDRVSDILGHSDISITQKFYKSPTKAQQLHEYNAVESMMNKVKQINNGDVH